MKTKLQEQVEITTNDRGDEILVVGRNKVHKAAELVMNGKTYTPDDIHGNMTRKVDSIEEYPGMRVELQ